MLLLYFLIFLAFSIFVAAFPMLAVTGLKWSFLQLGVFFSILSLVMAVVEGPILTQLTKRFSEGSLIIWGNLILGFSYLVILVNTEPMMYLAAVLYAIGNGLMWPCYLSILSRVGGTEYQG